MPMEKKEPVIILTKVAKDQFQDNILKQNFYPE